MIKDHVIKDLTCPSCKKEGEFESIGRLYCKIHFEESIQKRVRKHIRTLKVFKKDQKILVIGKLTEIILKEILKDLPLKMTLEEKYTNQENYDVIVLPWTLDQETSEFTNSIFYKKLDISQKNNNIVKLFINISDKEIKTLAKIRNIEIDLKRKKTNADEMVDFLEKKFPDTKFSYYNSISELKNKSNFKNIE